MKRQILKSLSTLCVSAMALFATSSLVVSCYDDGALWDAVEDVQNDVKDLQAKLEALTSKVDALYTLKFQVTAANELQYSFDGGATWVSTGVDLTEGCDDVSLVDNGDSVTITVGDQSFTIEKPEEIVFEIRAGKVYFESEGTMVVNIKSSGIEDVTVMSAPKGWWAEINSEGKVEITAPDYESTQVTMDYELWEEIPAENAPSGYVKVHACGADGKCMVGKIAVEVANQPLIVKAYGDNAYFTLAGTASYWTPTFFYGISTPETLEADTKDLLKRMNDGDYDIYDDFVNNYEETEVVESIEKLLGEEPAVGTQYIVWAVLESSSALPYDMEDLILAYYSPVSVEITEDESKKTAYNVTVNVEVQGADSYVALAIPGFYVDEYTPIEYHAEQMVMAMAQGSYHGQLYTENYTGSALDIAAKSQASATGNYSPDSNLYVLILPIDGRSADEYTVEDVVYEEFKTSGLVSGGSINVAAKQVTEYMGEVYDYENWQYVEQLIKLDPYTQIGVEVTPSATTNWVAFYYMFLTPEVYVDYAEADEDLVDYLLENSYGTSSADIKEWPLYLTEECNPASTLHFVAFMVDKDGKYGELAKVEVTTEELVKADFEWADPLTTNLVDDKVLKNTLTFEFTPEFEVGTAASYKYIWANVTNYHQYEGKDDLEMAETIFFSTSAKTVKAEDLVEGKIVVSGHNYGDTYYFAVVPIDANGAPGASAAMYEYTCEFVLDAVETSGEGFTASEPKIKINIPTLFTEDGRADGIQYYYQLQEYYDWDIDDFTTRYRFNYELTYNAEPVPGTTVKAAFVDANDREVSSDPLVKATQLWMGTFGSYHTATITEPFESSFRSFYNNEGDPAPDVYLLVSWVDAAGKYYYKEYNVQEDLEKLYDDMLQRMGGASTAELSVDGKQWVFNWSEFAALYELDELGALLDFGVSAEDYFYFAYDTTVMGGPGYVEYAGSPEYTVTPTDATSGVVTLIARDSVGDIAQTMEIEYSDLTETTCHFTCETLMFDADATVSDVVLPVTPNGVMPM